MSEFNQVGQKTGFLLGKEVEVYMAIYVIYVLMTSARRKKRQELILTTE